jgi:hypothetical protein
MNQALWLRIYILLIVLIIPSTLFFLINIFILMHARSSRQRVAPTNPAMLTSHRDIRLTKRMLILLLIFLFGWSPVYIVFSIQNSYSIWVEVLKLVAAFGLLGEIINLFLFNRKVSLFLKNKFLN